MASSDRTTHPITGSHDLALKNGSVVLPDGTVQTTVYVRDGMVSAIGGEAPAARVVDCTGLTILPGVIDTQVHFREPGAEENEDLETGSRSAVLGGVTGVFEMPNTKPTTSTPQAVADKLARARNRMWCEHAFYAGANNDNEDECSALEKLPGTAGIKRLMGSSTCNMQALADTILTRVPHPG